jgi:hypothetical protein
MHLCGNAINNVMRKVVDKVSKSLVRVAGEYSVYAELCPQGILALITPKNNPLYDIVAADPSWQ